MGHFGEGSFFHRGFFGFREPPLSLGAELLGSTCRWRWRRGSSEDPPWWSFSIAARSPWSSSSTVLKGATLASSGFSFTSAGTRSRQYITCVAHWLLDPERAILVEGGDSFRGRHKIRAAGGRGGFDNVHDGLFRRTVVPRRERVLRMGGGEAGESNHQQGNDVAVGVHGM